MQRPGGQSPPEDVTALCVVPGLSQRRLAPPQDGRPSESDAPGEPRPPRSGLGPRAIYLTLTIVTIAWTLGARDHDAAVRAAQQSLLEWSGMLRSAVQNSPWGSPRVGAAALGSDDAFLRALEEPTALPLGNVSAAGALPVARPQPLPTPRTSSPAVPELPGQQPNRPHPLDSNPAALSRSASLIDLPGTRYEATLVVAPDGGAPASLDLLAEIGATAASRRLRVTFRDDAGVESVRMEEILYGGQWYSWNPGVAGAWTLRDASAAPPLDEALGKLAWLLDPSQVVSEAGRQDMGAGEMCGRPAQHYRYGVASLRPEWLQGMDLPALESATIDVWVSADAGALLALELDGRGLTYAGKVHVTAHAALSEGVPGLEIRRPTVCVEAPLPPDVALPEQAAGVSHDCDSWTYTSALERRAAVDSQRQVLEANGWHVAEAESTYPDYVTFAKGVRRVVVRVAQEQAGAYIVLTVVQVQR